MDLFGYQHSDTQINLLPFDGEVHYFGPVLAETADDYLTDLLASIPWQSDIVTMFGKRIITKRQYAWYGDKRYVYKYSGSSRIAEAMPETLSNIKSAVESVTSARYNACLLNLYHDGSEGMGWHADDEPEIIVNSPIASVSFGADRRFDFKHRKTQEKVSLVLEHGSVLVMSSATQQHWLHQLPKTKKVSDPRINLTFRAMNDWTIAKE